MSTQYIQNFDDEAHFPPAVPGSTAIGFDLTSGTVKYRTAAGTLTGLTNLPNISATASTLAVTRALHAGRTVILNLVGGIAIQLPLATGSGDEYKFIVGIASNATVLSAVVATDDFNGGYMQNDTGTSSAFTSDFVEAGANDNTYSPTTLGGGGLIGDWFSVKDILANEWLFSGVNGGVIDPSTRFSAV